MIDNSFILKEKQISQNFFLRFKNFKVCMLGEKGEGHSNECIYILYIYKHTHDEMQRFSHLKDKLTVQMEESFLL